MTYKQLEYFFAISVFGSITRAASALGVSAPAITYAIQQLEQEIGVPLYSNGHRYKELTLAGETILEHAQILMQDYSKLNAGIAALQRGMNHVIKFAFFLGDELPRRITRNFSPENPTLRISMEQTSAPLITSGVQNKEYDIGITAVCAVTDDLSTVSYGSAEFGILVSNAHPLAEYELIPAEMLNGYTVAVPEFDSAVEDCLVSYCARMKIDLLMQPLPCGVYAKNAIIFRREIACVFPVSKEIIPGGFSFRRLDPPLRLEQAIIWRKDLHIDQDIRKFINFLHENRPKEPLAAP
jgi:DNA-binding transcriptional LysR family regulator